MPDQNQGGNTGQPQQSCPECAATLFYDSPSRRYVCKGCGLYVTKDELVNIRDRQRKDLDENRKKKNQQSEYLEWWLSSKK
ncbi:MAG: hypothetical protein ACYC7D_09500 [Nitrososphaerales archaeon]